jgi:D-alanyl-D-alanine carboxypeptidase
MSVANFFITIVLAVLSITPSFNGKTAFRTRLEEKLIGGKHTEAPKNTYEYKLIPDKKDDFMPFATSAKSAYFVDSESNELLFAKNENQRLPMASTTKLMTALIAIEKLDLNKTIEIKEIKNQPLDSVMGLKKGDKLTGNDLLYGLLIVSGSDAALALSEQVPGGTQSFVAMMNERAKEMGLMDTQFTNPVGWDDTGHYSTAKEVTKMGRLAAKNNKIMQIVAKKSYLLKTLNGRTLLLKNTNELLSKEGYIGLKTGTTYRAGECFTVIWQDKQKRIIGTILASPYRFMETDKIIEWTKVNFSW